MPADLTPAEQIVREALGSVNYSMPPTAADALARRTAAKLHETAPTPSTAATEGEGDKPRTCPGCGYKRVLREAAPGVEVCAGCVEPESSLAAAPREGKATASPGWREVGARLGAADPADPYVALAAIDEWEALGAQHADEAYERGKAVSASTDPEIVTGAEAKALPVGSLVVHVDGGNRTFRTGMGWRSESDAWIEFGTSRYRVLYRAPEPTPPLAVGDTVTTAAELERLPVGTIVEEFYGVVGQRRGDGDWQWTGGNTTASMRWPGVVRYLPDAAS